MILQHVRQVCIRGQVRIERMKVPPSHPLYDIFAHDTRFAPQAYEFVFNALTFAHESLGLGSQRKGEERHVTGQELCEAIRVYAQEEFGYMAKCVLNNWGVRSTGDFGEIVFNLIRAGKMRKTARDRREDFDDVFNFDKDLQQRFQINLPK